MNSERIILSIVLILVLMAIAVLSIHIGGTTGLTIAFCGIGLGWIGFSQMKRTNGS